MRSKSPQSTNQNTNYLIRDLASKTHIFEWSSNINTNSLIDCLEELFLFVRSESNHALNGQFILNAKPGHGKTQALQLICYQTLYWIKKTKKDSVIPLLIVLNEKKQQENLKDAVQLLLKEDGISMNSGDLICINSDNIKSQNKNVGKAHIVVITHSRLLNLLAEFEEYNKDYNEFPNSNYFNKQDSMTGYMYERRIIIDESPPFFQGTSFGLDNMEWLNPLMKRYHIESDITEKERRHGHHTSSNEALSLEEKRSKKIVKKEDESRQRYNEIIIRCAFQTALAKEFLYEHGPCNRKLKSYIDIENHELIEQFFRLVDNDKYRQLKDFKVISQYNWLKKLYYHDGIGMFDCESKNGTKKILCSRRLDYSIFSRHILIMDGTHAYAPLMYNGEYQTLDIEDRTNYERVAIHCRNYATSASNRKARKGKIQQMVAKDIENIRLENPLTKILPLMSKEEIGVYSGLGVIEENQRNYYEEKVDINQLPLHILNTRGKNFIADYSSLYLTSLPIRNPEYYKLQAISLYAEHQKILNFQMKERYDISKNWFLDERIQKLYEEDLQSELIQILHRTDLRKLNLPEENRISIYIATKLSFFLKNLMADTPFNDKFYSDNRSDKSIRLENQTEKILKDIISFMNDNGKSFPIRAGEVNRKTKRFLENYVDHLSIELTDEQRERMAIIDKVFEKENLVVRFVETKTKGKKEKRIDRIRRTD